jgi:hypothetical protein
VPCQTAQLGIPQTEENTPKNPLKELRRSLSDPTGIATNSNSIAGESLQFGRDIFL